MAAHETFVEFDASELSVNVFADDGFTPSVTVTVNVVSESADVGAPLMAPVDELNDNPAGNEPPLNV